MFQKRYKQKQIPAYSTSIFSGKSQKYITNYVKTFYQKNIQGKSIRNLDLELNICFNKIGRDETVHFSQKNLFVAVVAINIMQALEIAEFNNFGYPKQKHQNKYKSLGFLNFKFKCIIDGKQHSFRISVMIINLNRKKFQYSITQNTIRKLKTS